MGRIQKEIHGLAGASDQELLTIFVVSDATGETAERVVRSALVQFEEAHATVIRRGRIGTPEQLCAVVQEAADRDSLILHTLVSDELRHLILAESRSQGVDTMDLLGPVLDRLATHLRLTPQEKPGSSSSWSRPGRDSSRRWTSPFITTMDSRRTNLAMRKSSWSVSPER